MEMRQTSGGGHAEQAWPDGNQLLKVEAKLVGTKSHVNFCLRVCADERARRIKTLPPALRQVYSGGDYWRCLLPLDWLASLVSLKLRRLGFSSWE